MNFNLRNFDYLNVKIKLEEYRRTKYLLSNFNGDILVPMDILPKECYLNGIGDIVVKSTGIKANEVNKIYHNSINKALDYLYDELVEKEDPLCIYSKYFIERFG